MIQPTGRGASCGLTSVSLVVLLLLGMTGCVERRFLVTTDPPGTIVQVNGKTIGAAPIDVPFTYYGNYRLTLIRDGYQTMVVDQPINTPWYEYYPLDFVSENLIPWTVRDIRRFQYKMEPLQVVPPEALLQRSQEFRIKGQGVGEPVANIGVPQPSAGPGVGTVVPPPANVNPGN